MSVILFLILIELGKIDMKSSISKLGILIFLVGVLLTETLLFSQGVLFLFGLGSIHNYNLILFIASLIIVIGLLFTYYNQFKKSKVGVF